MRAVALQGYGSADCMQLQTLPLPVPGQGEVLLRVCGAGVNRPDVLQRMGLYPPPPGASPLLGLEVSGRVVATGEGVDQGAINQPVMALCNGGGYAEFVSVPFSQCMPVPEGVPLVDAASLPETYMTVWQNLVWKAQLGSGQHVLVHGGSSGIGAAAIQLAKCLGAVVHVTVGNPEKAAFCKGLGADHVYLHPSGDWVDAVNSNTNGRGVDVVLDMVAGPYLNQDFQCLAHGGLVIVIALLGGRTAEIDASYLLMKQARLTGSTLRPRDAAFKAKLAKEVGAFLTDGFLQGRLRTTVHQRFQLKAVRQAHGLMESGKFLGKIVLEVAA